MQGVDVLGILPQVVLDCEEAFLLHKSFIFLILTMSSCVLGLKIVPLHQVSFPSMTHICLMRWPEISKEGNRLFFLSCCPCPDRSCWILSALSRYFLFRFWNSTGFRLRPEWAGSALDVLGVDSDVSAGKPCRYAIIFRRLFFRLVSVIFSPLICWWNKDFSSPVNVWTVLWYFNNNNKMNL